jgi:hypothetical protein
VTIELREPRLVEQIKRLAADQAQPAEKVLETAVQAHLDKLEREAIHAETEAFWDMHDDLVKEYQGAHVALYQGEVVDHDEDASRLERMVREQFGELPVLIAPVKPGPRRHLRWIGGRIEANP